MQWMQSVVYSLFHWIKCPMLREKGSVKSCWTWNPNFLVILTTDHLMQNEVLSWWMGEWLVNALPCQHDFYLVPTDHFIVDFILLHGFQLQLTRVLDYKSCSHLQTALYSQLGTSITYFKVHVICSSIAGRLRVKSTFKKFRYVNNVSENIYVKSYTTFL